MTRYAAAFTLLLVLLGAGAALCADLQPRTVAAFDRYVRVTEQRMRSDQEFLRIDGLPQAERRPQMDAMHRGGLLIDRLATRDAGKDIDIPDGLVHHWVGMVFIPNTSVDKTLMLLQDYDHHAQIYAPAVAASKLLAHTRQ